MFPKEPFDEAPPMEALPAGFNPAEEGVDFLDAANVLIYAPA